MNDVIKQNPGLVQNMMSAVQNTVSKSQQQGTSNDVSNEVGGRREMQGPGFDISSLMGNIMMPPQPPMNTTSLERREEPEIDIEDDISDIAEPPVSEDVADEDGEVREVKVTQTKSKKGGGRKKKTVEINL
jgi:CO dehydrogenase/acetyl-CoA synthase delta subunit